MRDELAKRAGFRRRFQGCFVRFGTKSSYKGPPVTTVLLEDVVEVASGKLVTDHLWFMMGKRFESLKLEPGDMVRFDARVTSYIKGYRGKQEDDDFDGRPVERDYRLSFPTNLVKVVSTPKVAESFLK
jgi:hypothetical protein